MDTRLEFPPGAPVAVFGRRVGHQMSDDVLGLQYYNLGRLTQDPYTHTFGPGVEMWGLSDGGLLIRHPSFPLWDLRDLKEGEK